MADFSTSPSSQPSQQNQPPTTFPPSIDPATYPGDSSNTTSPQWDVPVVSPTAPATQPQETQTFGSFPAETTPSSASPAAPSATLPQSSPQQTANVFDTPPVQPLMNAPASPADSLHIDQPTIQQSVLTSQEQEELFGKEQLSGTQKVLIVLISIIVLGAIFGGGIWIYLAVNSDGSPVTDAQDAPTNTSTNTSGATPSGTNEQIDTDGDGLDDKQESAIGTDPKKADTDGDGYADGEEVKNGYSPLGK